MSADLSILQAWVDAVHDGRNVLAAVETACRKAQEGRSRHILGDAYHRVPERLRPLLGHPDGLQGLLGRWGENGGFQPGLAELEEEEARAYWLSIRGWSELDIARQLTPANRRFDRRLWISTEKIQDFVGQARAKVLDCFGI
jgi:hypothetical protein